MNRNLVLAVVIGAGLVVIAAAAVALVPWTQSSRSQALAQADRAVEVACRLVDRYDLQAGEGPPAGQLNLDDVRRVATQEPAAFEQTDARLRELLSASQEVERRHAPLIGAEAPPLRIGTTPEQIEANVRIAQDELADRQAWAAGLLDQAVQVLNEALAVAEAANHPEALRLRGLVRARQAQATHDNAERLRIQADLHRRRLMNLCQQVQQRTSESAWLTSRVPSKSVQDAETLGNELAQQSEQLKARIAELTATIERMKGQIQAAADAAHAAEQRIAELEAAGYDLFDRDSFRSYRQQLDEQWTILRQQEARATRVRFGDLQNAELGTRFGGDLVADRFFPADPAKPITYVRGLQSYEWELKRTQQMEAIVTEAVEAMERNLVSWGAGNEEAAGLQVAMKQASAQAQQQAASLLADAAAGAKDAQRLFEQADAEDQAADRLLNQAVADLNRALSAVQQRVSAARELLNPEKPNPRLEQIIDVRDLQAQMQAELGSILMMRAIVAAQRLQDLRRHEIVLATAGQAKVPELPTVDFAQQREPIIETARAAVDQAVQAMNKAVGQLSGKDYAWTALANEAVAKFLRLQIAGNPDDAAQALEALGQVVQGRERSPYVRTYAALSKYLEARPSAPPLAQPPAEPPAEPPPPTTEPAAAQDEQP